MDDNKICFVVYNNGRCSDNLAYIEELQVPENMQVECFTVEDVDNKFEGFNEVLQASDAKYKVYLESDVYIVNKNFIKDVIQIFKKNNDIGMIGMVGQKSIEQSREEVLYGKKIDDSIRSGVQFVEYGPVKSGYEEVDDLEDIIIVTAYDVPWRKELFQDVAVCGKMHNEDFREQGYKLVVAEQVKPWCIRETL